MSNSVKKTRRQLATSIVIVVLITAVVVGLILILGSGRETRTVTNEESDEEKTVVCTNSNDEKSFFKSGYSANPVKHEVRIITKNNKMDKLSIKYTGVYESEYITGKSSGLIHAAYNDLLGKNNIAQDIFSPNFMKNGSTLTIELYGNVNDINFVTSKLFYIEQSEFNKIKSLSTDGLKKIYENKGFSCDIMD